MNRAVVSTLMAAALFAGCYKAKVHVQAPQQEFRSRTVSDEFHFSLLGFVEISPEVDLHAACPTGAVSIEERVSFIGGLVNAVLGTYLPVLNVMNPSVNCGAGGTGAPSGPPGAY